MEFIFYALIQRVVISNSRDICKWRSSLSPCSLSTLFCLALYSLHLIPTLTQLFVLTFFIHCFAHFFFFTHSTLNYFLFLPSRSTFFHFPTHFLSPLLQSTFCLTLPFYFSPILSLSICLSTFCLYFFQFY